MKPGFILLFLAGLYDPVQALANQDIRPSIGNFTRHTGSNATFYSPPRNRSDSSLTYHMPPPAHEKARVYPVSSNLTVYALPINQTSTNSTNDFGNQALLKDQALLKGAIALWEKGLVGEQQCDARYFNLENDDAIRAANLPQFYQDKYRDMIVNYKEEFSALGEMKAFFQIYLNINADCDHLAGGCEVQPRCEDIMHWVKSRYPEMSVEEQFVEARRLSMYNPVFADGKLRSKFSSDFLGFPVRQAPLRCLPYLSILRT